MREFIQLDIKPYLNHRLIYNTPQQIEKGRTDFGLDNDYVLKLNLNMQESAIFNEVEFKFVFGKFDNITCEGQRLEIGECINKLHFIGFAYWGDTNEYFKVVYEDETEEMVEVPFNDWSHAVFKVPWGNGMCGENTETVKITMSSGASTHLVHFHHIVCDINKGKKVKEIIFPDNMFIHIFAITLEK